MSEEERYIIEFQPRPRKKPSEWLPVAGLLFKTEERAEEISRKQAEKLGVPTRVVKQPQIYEVWNFRKLMARMEGTAPALREMKKRGETGAIAGWAIYKQYVEGLLRVVLKREGADEAFRTTITSDLESVGEDELVEQIEGVHRKFPKGIPGSEQLDLIADWNDSLQRRVGRRIPKDPSELTEEEIEESKRITKEMHIGKAEKSGEEKLSDLEKMEKMKKELEERIAKLKE